MRRDGGGMAPGGGMFVGGGGGVFSFVTEIPAKVTSFKHIIVRDAPKECKYSVT